MKGLITLKKFADAPLEVFRELAGRGHTEVRGPLVRFHFVDDPHLAQRLLLTKELRHDPMVYEQLRPITGRSGMVQLVGAESRDLRSRLMPLVSPEGLQVLEAIVEDELARLTRALDGRAVVPLTELIYELTWRINYRYVCGDDRMKHSDEMFAAFKVIGRICGDRMRQLAPSPRWMPTGDNLRLAAAHRQVVTMLKDVMATSRGERVSVLSLLPAGELALDQLTTLMWAGHETTASGIITSLHYLSADAALQEQVAGNRKLATRVFKEAIRLHPPAYMLVRRASADVQVADVRFRRGDHVVVSLYGMHRRADLFPEPERFDPGRFAAKANPLGFLPFGLGAKRCFGEPVSYFEASKILAEVTRRYGLAPGSRPLTFDTFVTMVPQGDFELRIAPRRARGAVG